MSDARFLTTTDTRELQVVRLEQQPVLSSGSHTELDALCSSGGPAVLGLFAEPALGPRSDDGGYRSVAWYTSTEGRATRWTELEDGPRANAEQALRKALTSLRPILAGSPNAPLLGRALLIPSLQDVWWTGSRVVLTNWGMLPSGVETTPEALEAHYRETLGIHAPANWIPWHAAASPDAPESRIAPETPTPERIEDLPLPAPTPTPPGGVATVDRDSYPWYLTPGFLVFLALLLLTLGLWIGQLLRPAPASLGGFSGDAAVQARINRSLRQEIRELETLLAGDICGADATNYFDPPLRRPGESRQPPRPDDPPPARQEAAVIPEAAGVADHDGAAPDTSEQPAVSVRTVLRDSVVLVMNPGGGMGTGFFIAPDLVVTNRHVVEGAAAVVLASKALGKIYQAQVEAVSPWTKGNEVDAERGDYALLRLSEAANARILSLAVNPELLESVFVGGYPGFFMTRDRDWQQFMATGQVDLLPEIVMTRGDIVAIQQRHPDVPLLYHEANLYPGNSGGPLLDACGRVVGVNTSIFSESIRGGNSASDIRFLFQSNMSLGSSALARWLDEKQVSYTFSHDPC